MSNAKLAIDRRARLVKAGTTGEDELVDLILSESDTVKATYEEALDIRKDKVQRLYLEASLLADGSSLDDIAEVLEMPVAVVTMYADLFYDVSAMSRLQKLSVLDKERDVDARQFKSWCLTQGLEFVKWRMGKKARITPVEGLTSLFNDAFYKSKEAFFNANESEASRESAKWMKIAMDAVRQLKVWTIDGDEARKDIELALKSITGSDIEFSDIESMNIELYKEDENSD